MSEDGLFHGTLDVTGASARWTLDGESLFVHDVRGSVATFAALVDAANRCAVGNFASVLSVRFAEGDARIAPFRQLGFSDEAETPRGFVSLVAEVR